MERAGGTFLFDNWGLGGEKLGGKGGYRVEVYHGRCYAHGVTINARGLIYGGSDYQAIDHASGASEDHFVYNRRR